MNSPTIDISTKNHRPVFTDAEIKAVQGKGRDGLHHLMPARCYYDEEIYAFERERIMKKNWLAVGRWDWAEKPGDYFTLDMFGEPLVIIRDKSGQLHCLVNACRHRWSQIVDEGTGNKSLLVCPYHRWTYNLDGTLRGISVEPIEGLDRANCNLRTIKLEVWEGTIFLNFDPDAKPLAPQLAGVEQYLGRFNLGEMRSVGRTTYETSWNYKFSFETGYEAYHHAGVHKENIGDYAPPDVHEPIAFGPIWGIYGARLPEKFDKRQYRLPVGKPPWMSEEEADRPGEFRSRFLAVYPSLITYITPHAISLITTQHLSMERNIATTSLSVAPWAIEGEAAGVERLVQQMIGVQDEDTYACTMLQKGVRSRTNDFSVIHPKFEPMLAHYHQWMIDQYLTA